MSETPHSSALKVIKLLLLLSGVKAFTKKEIQDRLKITERSFYRYMNTLKEAGFIINNENGYYSMAKKSINFKEISSLLHFSGEEAYILNEAIHSIDASTTQKQNLISKLSALYDTDRIAVSFVKKEESTKIKPIIDAIKKQKQIRLINYQSSGSGKISSRIVEPFEFTPNYIALWAYEPISGKNKLFKISRIQKVELTDKAWQYKAKHKADLLDCFRIGGKKKIPVKFKMSLLAKNLLIEEYPLSEPYIDKINDNLYSFNGWVSSYQGIGRFILGLPEEIYDLQNTDLKEFIDRKRNSFKIF